MEGWNYWGAGYLILDELNYLRKKYINYSYIDELESFIQEIEIYTNDNTEYRVIFIFDN